MSDLIESFFPTEHVYNFRSSGNLFHLQLCRTNSYYNSFIPSTIKLWNELEADIKFSYFIYIKV